MTQVVIRALQLNGDQIEYFGLQNHKKIPPKLSLIFGVKHTQTPVGSRNFFIIATFSEIIHIKSCEKQVLFSHSLDTFDFFLLSLPCEAIFYFILELFKSRHWLGFNHIIISFILIALKTVKILQL
jgi:hypothetical protein